MSRAGTGRWQKAILRQLEAKPEVLLLGVAYDVLGRMPTPVESSNLNRAAHKLQELGFIEIGLEKVAELAGPFVTNWTANGHDQDHTLFRRPGLSDVPQTVVKGEEPEDVELDGKAEWWVANRAARQQLADGLSDDDREDYLSWLHPPTDDDDFDEVLNPEQVFDYCDGDYEAAASRIAEFERIYGEWRPDFEAERAAWKAVHGPFEPDPNYALDHYNDMTPAKLAALTAAMNTRKKQRERL
jgi:hypothetical protein